MVYKEELSMFEWKKEFCIGIEEIDAQHEKLFEIGNNIHNLFMQSKDDDVFDELVAEIDELKNYTVYHFDTEENLFKKYAYPESEAHIKEHRAFIDYLESINIFEMDENQEKSIADILKFIAKWIFKHISNTDIKYVDFLKSNM